MTRDVPTCTPGPYYPQRVGKYRGRRDRMIGHVLEDCLEGAEEVEKEARR